MRDCSDSGLVQKQQGEGKSPLTHLIIREESVSLLYTK